MLKVISYTDESRVYIASGEFSIREFVMTFTSPAPRLVMVDGRVYKFFVCGRRTSLYGQWDDGNMQPSKILTAEELKVLNETDFSALDFDPRYRILSQLLGD